MSSENRDVENKENKKLKNIVKKTAIIFPICVGFLFFCILVYLLVIDNVDITQKTEIIHSKPVQAVEYEVVIDETAPIGIREVYYLDLRNQLQNDSNLSFYVLHQYADVYVQNELVYSLKISDENEFGSTVGSNWAIVPIHDENTDKLIKVVITPVYKNFVGVEPQFILGFNHETVVDMLLSEIPRLFLGGTAIVVGLMFVIIGIYISVVKGEYAKLALLGGFATMMGMWMVSDSVFFSFVLSDKTSLLFYTSLAMLMLGTVPMLYIGKIGHSERFKSILNVCIIGVTFVCMIQLLLQIFGVMEIRENLFITHIIIGCIGILILIDSIISKIIENKNGKSKELGLTMVICVIGILVDMLHFYVSGTTVNLQFSLWALLICTIIAGIRIIHTYSAQSKQIEEQEAELSEKRISIMLSQIQPHFLYNSISAIQGLCIQDPEKAREALGDFAFYLRGNLNSLVDKGMIPFSKELSHVETYLNLEKMRFEERLNIVYDIEDKDFYIPPLVVQPLVENAVKHGICKNLEGGTLIIKTRKRENEIVISIIDDGVGFDIKEQKEKNDGKYHIGIQNVKDRLSQMAGGELIINSVPGQGTKAYIILKRED